MGIGLGPLNLRLPYVMNIILGGRKSPAFVQKSEVVLAIEHVSELFRRGLRQAYRRQVIDECNRPRNSVPNHPVFGDFANRKTHIAQRSRDYCSSSPLSGTNISSALYA